MSYGGSHERHREDKRKGKERETDRENQIRKKNIESVNLRDEKMYTSARMQSSRYLYKFYK